MIFEPASDQDLKIFSEQLGRPVRGVLGVGARCASGHPAVAVTAPRLPDGTPFPTLYYLTCPEAVKYCSQLEAAHLMEQAAALLEEAEFAGAYRAAHEDYLATRQAIEQVPEIEGISAGGMPERVKCFHALVGHALAAGSGVNPVGDWALEQMRQRGLWSPERCVWLEGEDRAGGGENEEGN